MFIWESGGLTRARVICADCAPRTRRSRPLSGAQLHTSTARMVRALRLDYKTTRPACPPASVVHCSALWESGHELMNGLARIASVLGSPSGPSWQPCELTLSPNPQGDVTVQVLDTHMCLVYYSQPRTDSRGATDVYSLVFELLPISNRLEPPQPDRGRLLFDITLSTGPHAHKDEIPLANPRGLGHRFLCEVQPSSSGFV